MSARGPRNRATPARAREDADKGVRECIRLMTSGAWVSGASHAEVAAKHGVAPATVKDWATSASRIIRLATEGDKEDIRARMLATLETIVARSMGREEPTEAGVTMTWGTDHKVAVAAIETQAKLLGLVVQKHEVRPSVAHLSRAEHLEALDKLEKEIADEKKRIAAEATS